MGAHPGGIKNVDGIQPVVILGMTIYTYLPNASTYPTQEQATRSTIQKTTPNSIQAFNRTPELAPHVVATK
jgi:hypothetical protein